MLSTDDLASERWVERVLVAAYDPGQWHRVAPVEEPRGGFERFGRRIALPGETAAGPVPVGAIVRTVGLAFSALPRDSSMQCAVVPIASPAEFGAIFRSPQSTLREAYARPPDRYRPASSPVASPPKPARSPLWRTEVVVRSSAGAPADRFRRAIAAAESGWRQLDGSGVRFGWSGPLGKGRPRLLLAESEVLGLLPGMDGMPSRAGLEPVGPLRLALGRSADGSVAAIPIEAHQGRHLAIVGETGMGKSSLLVALAAHAARLGGVVVLDPLGETARRVRSELRGEAGRLLWVDPGDRPPALNALEGIGGDGSVDPVLAERRIDDIVHALRRVRSGRYADSSFWGPRLEEMLTRAVRAAAAIPGGTLADAHTLLATLGRLRQVVPPSARDALRELADRVRERPEDAEGARRLLYEIARNPTLDRMLCARLPSLTARELVAPGRIVLVSGDASRVGEATARYLFAVYLALLWSELLARSEASKTFVVLDEAQWFAHESLSEMLRLARRLNVHVILATQTLGSLPEGVRDAVWANVSDFVAFRGSPDEARAFARTAYGISPEAILAMPRGEAVVLLGKGEAVRWVRTVRRPAVISRPDAPDDPSAGGPPEKPPPGRVPADPPDRGPSGASRPDPVARAPRGCVGVLERLRALGRAAEPGRLFEVVVHDLRSGDPEGDDGVRRAGALLGRSGAIVRVERGPRGTVWWIDPHRIPPSDAPVAESHAERTAAPPQPS